VRTQTVSFFLSSSNESSLALAILQHLFPLYVSEFTTQYLNLC